MKIPIGMDSSGDTFSICSCYSSMVKTVKILVLQTMENEYDPRFVIPMPS